MERKALWTRLLGIVMVVAIVIAGPYGSSEQSANAASGGEIEDAVNQGIQWLVEQQQEDGSWSGWGEGKVAHTAFAVVILEDQAFGLGFDDPFDPAYAHNQNVIDGLNYIFGQAATPSCCDDDVVFEPGNHEVYHTGIAMMAIAASKAPEREVSVPGSVVDGWTYRDVLQSNVDYFECAQNDDGGWRYHCADPNSDNSNTGYAALGLAYAQAPLYGFNCTIPDSVKSGLDDWIDHIQIDGDTPHRGGSGYGWPNTSNLLRAGNLVFEMAFVGDTLDAPRLERALGYLDRAWNDPDWSWEDIHSYPGWYGNPEWHGEPVYQEEPPEWWQGLEERWLGWQGPHYQAMYCMMKGLTFAGLNTIEVEGNPVDWHDAFSARIVETQTEDGSWPRDYWGGPILATEWALLTLQRVSPPHIVPVDIKPQSCPNPLNVKDKGVLPVAVSGTDDFDVSQIDPASMSLDGVAPLRWSLEDVATPYEPYAGKEDAYDCTEAGPDGYLDLVVMFDAQEVLSTLDELNDGDVRVLHLSGKLKEEYGSTVIVGEDVISIVKKGKK